MLLPVDDLQGAVLEVVDVSDMTVSRFIVIFSLEYILKLSGKCVS